MLTISQLAQYAGVTVRAVRHYHQRALLPEPERDHSGYRRYDAQAVVDLIRIRVLADAGVPLARVKDLLNADEREFAVAVRDIDARLRAEIAERERHREQVARLAAGDSLALPSEGVAYLQRLRDLDMPERLIEVERDSWILTLAAQPPEAIAEALSGKAELLNDPEFVGVLRALGEGATWEPDDPRIPAVADLLAAFLDHHADWNEAVEGTEQADAVLVELMDSIALDSVPAGRRLMSLLEERGWSGWTRLQRVARRQA